MKYLQSILLTLSYLSLCFSQLDSVIFSGVSSGYLGLSASSYWGPGCYVFKANPNYTKKPNENPSTWCSATADTRQWIQFSSPVPFYAHRISTKGRTDPPYIQWLTSYQLSYTLDGQTWTDYENSMILAANTNPTDTVTNELAPFLAIAVRMKILSWQEHPSTKADLFISIPNSNVTKSSALVPAIAYGMPVRVSSAWDSGYDQSRIRINFDTSRPEDGGRFWSSAFHDSNQWVQVSSILPQEWRRIHIQGRENFDAWVTSLYISYTLNGRDWLLYDNGKILEANFDRTTIKVIDLVPFVARSIRIRPVSWKNYINIRLEAFYRRIN